MFQMAVQLCASNNNNNNNRISYTALDIAMVAASMLLRWVNRQARMEVQLIRAICSNASILHRNLLKLTADNLDPTTVAAVIRRIIFRKERSYPTQIMFTKVRRLINSSSNIISALLVVLLWRRCTLESRISINTQQALQIERIISKSIWIRKANSTRLLVLLLLLLMLLLVMDRSQRLRT